MQHVLQPKETLMTSVRPLLFFIIKSIKREWVQKEKIKLNFERFFDNPLSKYLIFKCFFAWIGFIGLLTKIKKGSGTSFWCILPANFSIKISLIWYSINWLSFNIRSTFLLKISSNIFKFLFKGATKSYFV